MTAIRVATAAVGIPLFLGLCLWGPLPFALFIVLVAALALVELLRAYRAAGIRPNLILAGMGLLGPVWTMVAAPYGPPLYGGVFPTLSDHLTTILGAGVLAALALETLRAARSGEMRTGSNVAHGLLCGLVAALFGAIAAIRNPEEVAGAGAIPGIQAGAAALLITVASVWTTDSLAYFVGRAFGRRKLAPVLSPSKTVEGAVGGLAAALLAGTASGLLLAGRPLTGFAIGVAAGTLGQIGDLFESALKREIGTKDFGGILPGHGGVMDRFDSLLFTAPASLFLWQFLSG